MKKNFTLKASLFLSLGYLFAFFLFYLFGYLVSAPVAFLYAAKFVRDFAIAFLPVISSAVLLRVFVSYGLKSVFLSALLLTAPTLFYSVPLSFCETNLDLTYGGLFVAYVIISALLSFLISYARLLLLCLAALLIARLLSKKQDSSICELLEEKTDGHFDLSVPKNLVFLTPAAATFLISLISEIIETVAYLVSYAGSYRTGEIIYVFLKYILILVTFIASYVLSKLVFDKSKCEI